MRSMAFLLLLWFARAVCASEEGTTPPKSVEDYLAKAVKLSLTCVDQEFPNHFERYYISMKPKEFHPSFYGCYDWHSSVHGHWAMLRVLDSYPNVEKKKEILEKLSKHLDAELLKKELVHFGKDAGFERPYGYGWFLRLVSELETSALPETKPMREAVRPVEKMIVENTMNYLQKLSLPMREGMHSNTAFAMMHIWDYSKVMKHQELSDLLQKKSREFFGNDRNCPLDYEPSTGDFISPCFIEADLMRRVLPESEYRNWFHKFLPKITAKNLQPVVPSDLKDYIIGHMIGLMFQKSASIKSTAMGLRKSDPQRKTLEAGAISQEKKGWELMFHSGYGGTHWIASFAIFNYTDAWKTF